MLKNKSYIFLILIQITLISESKSFTILKTGTNFSYLRQEEDISKPGIGLGVAKCIFPIQSFNGFIGLGLDYCQKASILENRSWPSGYDPNDSNIVTGDINMRLSYVEIPVYLGYSIITKSNYTSSIYVGGSYSIPIKNHTKISTRSSIPLGIDERGSYDFDYIRLDENFTTISKNVCFGFYISYQRLALLFSYSKAISTTEGITNLNLRDKIDYYSVSAAFLFGDIFHKNNGVNK
jgi:hypothetical protein